MKKNVHAFVFTLLLFSCAYQPGAHADINVSTTMVLGSALVGCGIAACIGVYIKKTINYYQSGAGKKELAWIFANYMASKGLARLFARSEKNIFSWLIDKKDSLLSLYHACGKKLGTLSRVLVYYGVAS